MGELCRIDIHLLRYGVRMFRLCMAALLLSIGYTNAACERSVGTSGTSPMMANLRADHVLKIPPTPLMGLELTQENNIRWAPAELQGAWTLVFAGYTSCPDVCPVTLSVLAQALQRLRAQGDVRVGALFVSIDPEHDGQAKLEAYAAHFDPALKAVTGNKTEIDRFCAALGAGYEKGADKTGAPLFDHSTSIFVVDPAAQVVATIMHPSSAAALMASFRKIRATGVNHDSEKRTALSNGSE